jgi:excisionase family DNA binding protein
MLIDRSVNYHRHMTTQTERREEWLAVKEVAAELRLSTSAVYKAIEQGSLPVVRLHEHGAIRIHRSILDQHRKEHP